MYFLSSQLGNQHWWLCGPCLVCSNYAGKRLFQNKAALAGYPGTRPKPDSIFGSHLPVNYLICHTNGILKCACGEWGWLLDVFNIKAGNYYSKSTFIMTLIKRENLVFILVILYTSGVVICFTKLFIAYPRYPKISNFGYPVPEITENAQPWSKCKVKQTNFFSPEPITFYC